MMNTHFVSKRLMKCSRLLMVLLGLLWLLSVPAWAAITRGAICNGGSWTEFGPGVNLSFNLNWSKPTTDGSLLVAMVSVRYDSGNSTLTVPSGFVLQGSKVTNSNGIWVACYAYVGAPSQTSTGTWGFVDNTNSTYGIGVACIEYQGAATSSPLDKHPVGKTGFSATVSSPSSGTLSQSNEVVVAGLAYMGPSVYTSGPTNGFTASAHQEGIASELGDILADKIVSSTASQSTSIGLGSSLYWAAGIWSFKAAP